MSSYDSGDANELTVHLDRFDAAWSSGGQPPRIEDYLPRPTDGDGDTSRPPPGVLKVLIELVAIDLWHRWNRAGNADTVALASTVNIGDADGLPARPWLDDYLTCYPQLGGLDELPIELIGEEYRARHLWGDKPAVDSYVARFPQQAAAIRRRCATYDTSRVDADDSDTEEKSGQSDEEEIPDCIGRFKVKRLLGQGTFGRVFLARDDELDRDVAIKVPHDNFISRPEYVELYRKEAKTVASLDGHPHIVLVYDVDGNDDFPYFVVSKYIDGTDLATRLKSDRHATLAAAQLVATVAETLAFAHQQGVVHRDIKPANILLDKDGVPYVADFGLALREQELGSGPRFVGTPAYMSPEQARNEGHRVDGRSDIFALGVVLYELLIGRKPFRGETQDELLDFIASHEPKPPRQIDGSIALELERICLKALAKRLTERYTTAQDMAEDLRAFIAGHDASSPSRPTPPDKAKTAIVPRGLRCFDENDADFFLDLLPGPRDRDGLPESIAFWKTRIEQRDPDRTFTVGLIYGPSGCGKTSLVRAGLLPRLADHVVPVYVEATASDTQQRLLNTLRRQCPALSRDLSLVDSIAALRRGEGTLADRKVVLVIDQFEQWLHAYNEGEDSELAQALRHCNGERVQCVLMVRDDFWMAITRLMRSLDIELLQGKNFAAVDVFDLRHSPPRAGGVWPLLWCVATGR